MGRHKNKKDIPLWARTGHKKPTTRREFLASGLIGFSAVLTGPSLLSLLLRDQAVAAELNCAAYSSSAASILAPFITVNLSGGSAMAANFVPMDAGGQPLPSYNVMGLGDGAVPIEREFGNVPFAGQGISKFMVGLRLRATAATIANTAFVGVCVRSQDDSGNNKFDSSGMLHKAGLVGALLPNIGRRASATGINQMPAFISPPAPLVVNSVADIRGALGYTGALNTLTAAQKTSLAETIQKLSASQSRKLASSGSAGSQELIDCVGIKNKELIGMGGGDINPTINADLNTLWGINAATALNNAAFIAASMVYTALNGNAGSANLEIGGFDYHDNSRTSGDAKDQEAGEMIGRILESARIMNRKVFIYVTSDGAVSSPQSTARNAPWSSDRGSAGAAYMIAYDPAGRPATSGFQLGQFTTGQAADDRFVTGNDPERAAAAVFINYLNWNKKMDLISKVGLTAFSTAELDQILKFV